MQIATVIQKLAVLFLLTICGFAAFAEIVEGPLELVSQNRVSRFIYEYTYKLNVTNTGSNVENVTATVSSSSDKTVIVDGALSYGNIAAGASQASSDSFSFRQDRRIPVGSGTISYAFNYDDATPPPSDDVTVQIGSPASLTTFGASPIIVSGIVSPIDAKITLNGVNVSNNNGTFSGNVDLQEGSNVIDARASKSGAIISDIISVSLDLTPPYLTIDSHQNQQKVFTERVTITGLVNDIVRGTIENDQANATVNGVSALIVNRSYSAEIPLFEGENVVKVTGSDQVGNTNQISITLIYEVPIGKRIVLVGGQGQSAMINEKLPQPLQIMVLDDNDDVLPDEAVVFRVFQGSGAVGVGTSKEGRAVVIDSDVSGIAKTEFKLGTRAGTANHKISVSAVGFDNEVIFHASATGQIGNKLSVNSGNNQRGAVGQVLPQPLVVVVTDNGANVVKDSRIRFDVTAGGGHFSANDQTSIEVVTDSDGRATAELVLGELEGIDAQTLLATLLDGPVGQVINAGFTATAFVPSATADTTVSGVVLDNQDTPIPGVTVRIEGTSRQAQTDGKGLFQITQSPIGPIHIIADGSTATVAGEFPSLSYQLVTISGVDNPLPAPIYMVKLDTENAVFSGSEDVVLTLDAFPGFKLEIAANSVTFPDGSTEGLISVTSVNASKVPMAPPNGMQPQFIVTIQPTGTRFDPPARLSLPNVDAHAAGAQVEMYSFDHDLEEFVSIGLGTVTEDGLIIVSNPGVGVIKAGWHCGSQPAGSGCCAGGNKSNGGCAVCKKRQGNDCTSGNCIPDDSQDPKQDCKGCSGGELVNDDSKALTGDDKECKKCKDGTAAPDLAKNDNRCKSEDPKKLCYTCKDGKCGNHCDASKTKDTLALSTGDLAGLSSIVNKIKYAKFPPLEVADASASVSVNGSIEKGEKCCADCSTQDPTKNKSAYTKYEGTVKLDAFIKIGFVGTSGGTFQWVGWTDYRVGVSYEVGPFLTVKGELKGRVSYTDSDCEEGDCFTVGVGGGIGAQLDVGGSVRAGFDYWDYEECSSSRQGQEVDNYRSECFTGFKGAAAELWATGGASVSADIANSDCPAEVKCELVLGKVVGKIFYKAVISGPFFSLSQEGTIVEGTFYEGKTFSCL